MQAFGFSHPDKERLEHFLSLRGDLGRSDEALSSLLDRASLFGGGGLLAEAIFTVAIISYIRCFASGRRKGLSADIFAAKPRLLNAHEEFKSIRDKHIAHPVGVLENLHVMVAAADPSSPAQGVGSLGVFFSHTRQRSTLLLLRQVVRYSLAYVDRQIEEIGSKLASEILGRPTSWKNAQKAFFAAIGDSGYTRESRALEEKVMNGAPGVVGRKSGASKPRSNPSSKRTPGRAA